MYLGKLANVRMLEMTATGSAVNVAKCGRAIIHLAVVTTTTTTAAAFATAAAFGEVYIDSTLHYALPAHSSLLICLQLQAPPLLPNPRAQ